MSTEWLAAANTVADVLTRENQALAAMDLRAATALLEEKQRACAALDAVQARLALSDALQAPAVRALARRLDTLTKDNRAWLERGLAAQGQVISLIIAAARKARRDSSADPARYTARGTPPPVSGRALALSARV